MDTASARQLREGLRRSNHQATEATTATTTRPTASQRVGSPVWAVWLKNRA